MAEGRVIVVDQLRGLAALAVCWLHLAAPYEGFLPRGAATLNHPFIQGGFGVQVFFVISGFVLPFALYKSGYKLSDYGAFWLKRIVRLEPPYLASVVFALGFGLLFGALGVPQEPVTLPRIAAHVGYLNRFLGMEFLNLVYWTLVIEFQFYLLIGLAFPLVGSSRAIRRVMGFGLLACLAYAFPDNEFSYDHNMRFITTPMFYFLMGIAAFQFRVGLIGRRTLWFLLPLFVLLSWPMQGRWPALLGMGAALTIAHARFSLGPILSFLGAISYSLYLTHYPLGTGLLKLTRGMELAESTRWALMLATLALCIAFGWLAWRFIELPAVRWASRIRYRRPQQTPLPSPAVDRALS